MKSREEAQLLKVIIKRNDPAFDPGLQPAKFLSFTIPYKSTGMNSKSQTITPSGFRFVFNVLSRLMGPGIFQMI
jgi:hypothetical protein